MKPEGCLLLTGNVTVAATLSELIGTRPYADADGSKYLYSVYIRVREECKCRLVAVMSSLRQTFLRHSAKTVKFSIFIDTKAIKSVCVNDQKVMKPSDTKISLIYFKSLQLFVVEGKVSIHVE